MSSQNNKQQVGLSPPQHFHDYKYTSAVHPTHVGTYRSEKVVMCIHNDGSYKVYNLSIDEKHEPWELPEDSTIYKESCLNGDSYKLYKRLDNGLKYIEPFAYFFSS